MQKKGVVMTFYQMQEKTNIEGMFSPKDIKLVIGL